MSRDPVAYPEPDRFMPERYLKEGRIDPKVRDPLKFQFGFGRRYVHSPSLRHRLEAQIHDICYRICPGMPFSQDSLFIAVVSILHAFDVRPVASANGSSIPIHLGPKIPSGSALSYVASVSSRSSHFHRGCRHPDPFECSITPRSEHHASIIQQLRI